MADWSMISCDILGVIALKLEFDDFIRFSAVCHSWNDASSQVKYFQNPKVPWLLLAENTTENPDCVRKAYDLSHDKCYRLKVPETFGKRCWGSSYAWIAMQTFDYQVHLFNPLTKVQVTNFPSILTMPEPGLGPNNHDPEPDNHDPGQQWYFAHFVRKLVVLKMPRNRPHEGDGDGDGDGLLIAAIYGEWKYLALARPGDQSWTYIEPKVEDVLCSGDRIYMVRRDGQLVYFDIKGCGGDLEHVNVMEYAPSFLSGFNGYDKTFLLDLCGDLVMVSRNKIELLIEDTYLTESFDVYRFDIKIKKWVTIKDIGIFSLFLGHHSSMAIPTSVANNCISNCIYFTDDESVEWEIAPGFGGHDIGVYNIGSGDIKQFYQGDDTRSPFCPPIFLLPK